MHKMYDTINLRHVSLPLENPVLDCKVSYETLKHSHGDVLLVYQILVNELLSPFYPLHINDLKRILRSRYKIDEGLVNKAFIFFTNHETTGIEFETVDGCVLGERIYKKPRVHVSTRGTASPYFPHE